MHCCIPSWKYATDTRIACLWNSSFEIVSLLLYQFEEARDFLQTILVETESLRSEGRIQRTYFYLRAGSHESQWMVMTNDIVGVGGVKEEGYLGTFC